MGAGPSGTPALQTGLSAPAGVAVDSSGNVYVSLTIDQIWKINTAGAVTRYAGNGVTGYNGESILATAAAMNGPQGMAFDAAGNLYVAERTGNRIRKISTSGAITTVAGNGAAGGGGDGGLATSASLSGPVAVAVDASNNLYIVDKGNNKIRRVAGGVISTVAGTGGTTYNGDGIQATAATLYQPTGVAVDSAGAVYVADNFNFRIRKFTPGGTISTFAGTGSNTHNGDGGTATSAGVTFLTGIAIDSFNNVFILEDFYVRVVVANQPNLVTLAGTGQTGFAGDGGAPGSAVFHNLTGLALNGAATQLYLADSLNNRIRAISSTVSTFAGNGSQDFTGNGGAAVSASLYFPRAVFGDNAGSLFFNDTGSSGIRKLTLGTGLLSVAMGTGFFGSTPDGGSTALAVSGIPTFISGNNGSFFFVEGARIRKASGGVYSTVGNASGLSGFSGDGGLAVNARFSDYPQGLALATNGDLYISDTYNNRVRVINGQTGIVTTIAGTGVTSSSGDGGLAVNATLNQPWSLALDGAGNLFVSETNGFRVRKINVATNIITTVAGNGGATFTDGVAAITTGVTYPYGLFADQSSNLFIADYGHSRVRKVDAATGLISTVAGNGNFDYTGDGGPAVSASVLPFIITVDRAENLYISDYSGRIRQTTVTACFFTIGTPTFYAGSGNSAGSVTVTATHANCPYNVSSNLPFVTITSGASGTGNGTVTFNVAADSGQNRAAMVNIGGASFAVAQAGAFGPYNVGYFNPASPTWALDSNGSGAYEASDRVFSFAGQPGAIAVTGDWNGDGRTKIGYYLNGFWVLDYNGNGVYDGTGPGGDKFYGFGGAGYTPVVGDWNGDGKTKVGFYYNGAWALDSNGNGTFDAGDSFFGYGGNAGEVPVVGDWNGNGRTKIGVFYNGTWVLDYDGNGTFTGADKYYNNFTYAANDRPVVGDWTGDGKTKIGIYRGGFWVIDNNGNGTYDGTGPGQDKFYGFGGNPGEIPFVADWNGSGTSKIGIYVNGFWVLDFNGNGGYDGTGPGGDRFIAFGGPAGSQPVIGRW